VTTPGRPDPDALLAVTAEARRNGRGRLRIFLGASPGVGKTYSMLEAAQAAHAAGRDVVVGLVETHGRAETRRLLEGLTLLPRQTLTYRERTFDEFDLDAALARRPHVCLVDELAHTNVPGARHAKRWQDVEELRDAGIEVWTTLNIQHLESLNDIVAGITGVHVRETIPDAVLDGADALELVDVSVDVLRERLIAGQVYAPHMAGEALERFFRPGNLSALRELALRRTADRVDADVRDLRRASGAATPWRTAERVLAVLKPGRDNAALVRQAHRLAARLRASLVVLYVETPDRQGRPAARDAIEAALRLAESLGADTATIPAVRETPDVLAFAHARNVTTVLHPAPAGSGWRRLRDRVALDALVRAAAGMDVLVAPVGETAPPPRTSARSGRRDDWVAAVGLIGIVTGVGAILRDVLSTTDVAMLFVLATAAAGARARRGPALVAAGLAIAAFDFFFVPPFYTFAVSDVQYLLTFAVMLAAGLVVVTLTSQLRAQTNAARDREQRTAVLFALSRELASSRTLDDVATAVRTHVGDTFAARVRLLRRAPDGALWPMAAADDGADEKELAVARWAAEHATAAGWGTTTLPAAESLWLPLDAGERVLGVLGVVPRRPDRLASVAARSLLDALRQQAALAMERVALAEEGRARAVEVEAERLRSTLLSSLSHDLRTPLAGIEGAASTLVRDAAQMPPDTRRDMAANIVQESQRLNRLVGNLLEMVRVESGALALHKEWMPLDEVVGVVLIRLDALLASHPVTVQIPADLPLAPMDPVLIEQVLGNLLENAVRHTPAGTPVRIGAGVEASSLEVWVEDDGPGLPAGDTHALFERFVRGEMATPGTGIGLGLAICRGIVTAHGGSIRAERRVEGGARFRFTLPLEGGLDLGALATAESQDPAP
jgi:two-component system sensor histidine kinase KdpD